MVVGNTPIRAEFLAIYAYRPTIPPGFLEAVEEVEKGMASSMKLIDLVMARENEMDSLKSQVDVDLDDVDRREDDE
ncbi:hypothetical protein ACHAXH_004872 [Discostella pseudostelligera]